MDAVARHRAWMAGSGELERRRRERARRRIRDVVERELRRAAWSSTATDEVIRAGLDRIQAGEATPYSVAADILSGLLAEAPAR
jgi:putative protein kinase ArgK-like GTPase of G3E family